MHLHHLFFNMLQTLRRLHTSPLRDFDALHPRCAAQPEFIPPVIVANAEGP